MRGVQVQRNRAEWPSNLVAAHVTAGRRRYAAMKTSAAEPEVQAAQIIRWHWYSGALEQKIP